MEPTELLELTADKFTVTVGAPAVISASSNDIYFIPNRKQGLLCELQYLKYLQYRCDEYITE